jgi:hypothetical protein
VERNCISAYDEILNAVGVEERQEFLEVVEHLGPVPSWRRRKG